ncbi:uncharacterized protein LOC101455265 [Ceratitis capitata]|uniref:uncharacterized protein LOC101455265 n=1 Tax=Ceratitis capitata TaxID=7213 RepID=UPI00032A3BD9|nr:uncharacterized protein LOC101455265 [Ceratitis capitata]
MHGAQICVVLFLVACSCFTLTTSLSCYICDSSLGQNCSTSTTTATCNSALAQQTTNYALQYLNTTIAQLNVTSSTYACVSDYMMTATSNHSYLGCAYSTVNICNFEARKMNYLRYCDWCSNNNCNRNPADRVNSNIITMGVTMMLLFVAKILCN